MNISRRKWIQVFLLLVTGFLFADGFWIEKFFIEIKEYFIGNATAETKNIKVIQVSDLHLQKINTQLKVLAKKINAINPSLVLFSGDAVDKDENTVLLEIFLQLIDPHIQKVAITGNWEYWGNVNLEELNNVYARNNGTLLINQSKQYSFHNKTITITGVDDFIGGKADVTLATSNYQQSDYHIILNHCPQYGDIIAQKIDKNIKVDFIASGHTHGGQVNLFGYIPFIPVGSGRYIKGWYKDRVPGMYVSKGVGTSVLPIRLGARAEVSIFNFST